MGAHCGTLQSRRDCIGCEDVANFGLLTPGAIDGQIDTNGDGTLEWEEFSSFVVEMGMSCGSDAEATVQYHECHTVLDSTLFTNPTRRLTLFSALDQFRWCIVTPICHV